MMISAPRNFTLIEMLVVVAIIAILAALMTPALHKALETARDTQCLNNLRQTGIAFGSYSSDFQGFYPPANSNELNQARAYTISWDDAVYSYLGGTENRIGATSAAYPGIKLPVLQCPFDASRGGWRLSYCMALGYGGTGSVGGNAYRAPRKINFYRSRVNGQQMSPSVALLLTDQHWHRGQGQGGAISVQQYWDGNNHYSAHSDGQALMGLYMGLNAKRLWRQIDIYGTAPELNWHITGPIVW